MFDVGEAVGQSPTGSEMSYNTRQSCIRVLHCHSGRTKRIITEDSPDLFLTVAEVAEFYSLDLLHVHYAIPHSVSALLARQMLASRGIHLPFITTLHGTDITLVGLDRSYLPITKFGIEQSDGVTAISTYLRNRTHEAFHIDSEIEVIRNFVNCDVYVRNPALIAAMRRCSGVTV